MSSATTVPHANNTAETPARTVPPGQPSLLNTGLFRTLARKPNMRALSSSMTNAAWCTALREANTNTNARYLVFTPKPRKRTNGMLTTAVDATGSGWH